MQGSAAVTLAVLLGCFGLFGAFFGALGVLWAELMAALRLSEGTFGSVQLAAPLVAIAVLLAGGPLCARVGKQALTLLSLALCAGSALGLAGTRSLGTFVGALVLWGAGSGFLETALNGAALDWEQAMGRPVMNVLHAGFSAGAVLGALGAGALLESAWRYGQVLVLLAALSAAAAPAVAAARFPSAGAEASGAGAAPDGLRLLRHQPALTRLALVAVQGIVGESVAYTWSVIYLRTLGAPALAGGAVLAGFNGAMLVGRLSNAALVARWGASVALRASGAGLIVSAGLLAAPGGVLPAAAAFILMGLAVAGVVPTVLGAAARMVPGQTGAVAGAIMAAAYGGFIACPPLIGWLAELISLRAALLAVGLAGLAVLWLTRQVRA